MSINAKKTVNVKAATAMLNDHKRYDSLQTDPERVEYLNELLYLQFDKADFDMVEAILDSDVIREGTDYCTAEAWDNDTNILAYRKMLDVMYNAYIKIAFNRAKGAFNVLFDLSDSNHVIVVDFIDYTTSFLIDSELCGTLEEGEISEAAIELDIEDEAVHKVREGMELTLKMMNDAMSKIGVTEIPTVEGDVYSADLHQAMSMQEVPGKESNTIIAVVQKGYKLNDRLIRPAMVMVAK